jgi:hypothetical protein
MRACRTALPPPLSFMALPKIWRAPPSLLPANGGSPSLSAGGPSSSVTANELATARSLLLEDARARAAAVVSTTTGGVTAAPPSAAALSADSYDWISAEWLSAVHSRVLPNAFNFGPETGEWAAFDGSDIGLPVLCALFNHSCQPTITVRIIPQRTPSTAGVAAAGVADKSCAAAATPASVSATAAVPIPVAAAAAAPTTPVAAAGAAPAIGATSPQVGVADWRAIALTDVRRGEPLFTSYVDTRLPVRERRALLQATYGFDCHCSKCKADMQKRD